MKENRDLEGKSKRGCGLELIDIGSYRRIFKMRDIFYVRKMWIKKGF